MADKDDADMAIDEAAPARPSRRGGKRVDYAALAGSAGDESDSGRAAEVPAAKKPRNKAAAKGKAKAKNDDKDYAAAKPAAPARGKAPVRRNRVQGRLATVVQNFPLEVVNTIMSFSDPPTLLALTRVNKMFHSLLSTSSAKPIWAAAFATVDMVPLKSTRLNLQQFAALIWLKNCAICSRRSPKVEYASGTRLCASCITRTCLPSYRVKQLISLGMLTRSEVAAMLLPPAAGANEVEAEDAEEEAEADEGEGEEDMRAGLVNDEAMAEREREAGGEDALAALEAGSSNAARPADTILSIHPAAYNIVGEYWRGHAYVLSVPYLIQLSDELDNLEQQDVEEFGELARADRSQPYDLHLLAAACLSSPTAPPPTKKASGTRVKALYDLRREQSTALREDAANILSWERREAIKSRNANLDMTADRKKAIIAKLTEEGFDTRDITKASMSLAGRPLFDKAQALTARVWTSQRSKIVETVDAAKSIRLEAEHKVALELHRTRVIDAVLGAVIATSPLSAPPAGDEPAAERYPTVYNGTVSTWKLAFKQYALRAHFKAVSTRVAAALQTMEDPLWVSGQTEFEEMVKEDLRHWWEELSVLLLKLGEALGSRDVSDHSVPQLLAKTFFACRTCHSPHTFLEISSHVGEGHQLFVDSKMLDTVFEAVTSIADAYEDSDELREGFIFQEAGITQLLAQRTVFSCTGCKARIRATAAIGNVVGKGEPSTSTSAQPTASTSAAAAAAVASDSDEKRKAEDDPSEKKDTSPRSINISWTLGVPPTPEILAVKPYTGLVNAKSKLLAYNVDLKEMLRHVCGGKLSSAEDPATWQGCPYFSTITKQLTWTERDIVREARYDAEHYDEFGEGGYDSYEDDELLFPFFGGGVLFDDGYDSFDDWFLSFSDVHLDQFLALSDCKKVTFVSTPAASPT